MVKNHFLRFVANSVCCNAKAAQTQRVLLQHFKYSNRLKGQLFADIYIYVPSPKWLTWFTSIKFTYNQDVDSEALSQTLPDQRVFDLTFLQQPLHH